MAIEKAQTAAALNYDAVLHRAQCSFSPAFKIMLAVE